MSTIFWRPVKQLRDWFSLFFGTMAGQLVIKEMIRQTVQKVHDRILDHIKTLIFNGSQLAKMKKYIPYMSVP